MHKTVKPLCKSKLYEILAAYNTTMLPQQPTTKAIAYFYINSTKNDWNSDFKTMLKTCKAPNTTGYRG